MKILMVNKFLHPKGGAETYVFKLGAQLQTIGHEVQYFGMEHEGRIVGNHAESYTTTVDFHHSSKLEQLSYPFRIIYSSEARKKIRLVLDDFQPDVCHLNNFNYQLTPSIIIEIRKWEKESGHKCRIVYTAHDYQLVCPNHLCHNPNTHENCEKCLGGNFFNCSKGKCIHGSFFRSVLGTLEASLWNKLGVYKEIDKIICCSNFIKTKLDTNQVLAKKTVVMHNFVEPVQHNDTEKKDYVLYFGRYSIEKGLETLVEVARELPEVQFVFAGSGPLESLLEDVENVHNVGFQNGKALEKLIREARFSIYPSECYENCPFSVLESIMYGTPVLGANIGGIPELILESEVGVLFESGNAEELKDKISELWLKKKKTEEYTEHCNKTKFSFLEEYTGKLISQVYS